MNLSETKWLCKVIWAWQDEKEEQWLEEKAMQGWHLVAVAPFFYKFRKGASQKVVYRLDYKFTLDKDYKEYQALYQDSGWEQVTTMSNWHYYRIEADNERVPEIYNSHRAKAQKYRRLLFGLLPSMVVMIAAINPIFVKTSQENGSFLEYLHLFFLAILLFLIYAVIRVILKIRKLESGSKE